MFLYRILLINAIYRITITGIFYKTSMFFNPVNLPALLVLQSFYALHAALFGSVIFRYKRNIMGLKYLSTLQNLYLPGRYILTTTIKFSICVAKRQWPRLYFLPLAIIRHIWIERNACVIWSLQICPFALFAYSNKHI